MKIQIHDIIGTKFTTKIIVACIIMQYAIAQRGPCINGECTLESDECYKDQCYEVVGDCNESKQCEHNDSECVDTAKKTNICIWLKTPEADDATVPTDDVTVPTDDITTLPISTPDECYDRISGCSKYYYLCKNELYKSLMLSLCQLTCGYCEISGTTATTPDFCKDMAASNKPSDCPLYSCLCNHSIYKELMKEQCPKTCGFCDSTMPTASTSPICEDKKGIDGQSNCSGLKYLCYVPLYIPLISIQCPHTCGLC